MYRILGIGELLWDMLPSGPQLGGAPANYSVMAARLGNDAAIVSRVGADVLGRQALEVLGAYPVDCGLVQQDCVHETGRVTVALDAGQPSYTIHAPAAWDFLEATAKWLEAAAMADAVCFGTLAQRHPAAQAAMYALLAATGPECERIFDVNLRAPFYSAEILLTSLRLATVVKMNDEEVPLVARLAAVATAQETVSLREGAERLLAGFPNVKLVAITRGGHGSLLVAREAWDEHAGVSIQVADTIGAGDAFTAALTHYLLRGAPLETLSEAGNRWGSFIASERGAMPPLAPETVARITAEIEG